MRNGWIDIGRFVFALLVVFIHVPMRGSIYLWPFARCAVPFFFLIAGYFCYSDDSLQFKNSINKNYKKWFFLWLKYTSMIISVVIVINYIVGLQNVTFSYVDIINFFKEGACSLVDVVTYKNQIYGINTLWFLYAGSLAFFVFFLIRRFLFYKPFLIISLVLYSSCIAVNYFEIIIPRFFSLAMPFIYLGFICRKYENYLKKTFFTHFVTTVIFTILSYSEVLVNIKRHNAFNTQCYWTTPLMTLSLFLLLLSAQQKFPVKKSLPTVVILDIYIWHRFVFFILTVMGVTQFMFSFDALGVFLINAIIAFAFRFAYSKKK